MLFFGRCKESLEYAELALQESYISDDTNLIVRLRILKGKNFSRLYLFKEEKKEYLAALGMVSHKNGLESRIIEAQINMLLGDYYIENSDLIKAKLYLNKAKLIVDDISNEDYLKTRRIYHIKYQVYYYLGFLYQRLGNINLSLHFFLKSYAMAKADRIVYVAHILNGIGDCYSHQNLYRVALDYYKKSIEITYRIGKTNSEVTLKVSKMYSYLGDHQNSKKYLEISYKEVAREKAEDRSETEKVINHFLNKKDNEITQNSNVFKFSSIVYLLVFFSSICFIHYKVRLYRKRKQSELLEKERYIHETKKKTLELEQKLNVSFQELIDMAKKNDPHFWCRFQEGYPGFTPKLLEVNPNLKVSELTFCAYVFLGFTTKEIANYTYRTIKTIENNRYNIRKRLQLSPDIDLLIWLENQTGIMR